jgi:ferredoxin
MAEGVKVTIDREECILCGICWETCPDVFEEGDDGFSQIVTEYRTDDDPGAGVAPADQADCVGDAALDCPVEIIHVED